MTASSSRWPSSRPSTGARSASTCSGAPRSTPTSGLATNEGRVARRASVDAELVAALAAAPADEWIERLEAAGIPCGRVRDVAGVLDHPQLAHNGLVTEVGSPVGPLKTIGAPFLVDGTRPSVGPVPGLGEG